MRTRRLIVLAAATAAPTFLSTMVHAADSYTWTPPNGGNFDWTSAANWTGGTSLGFPQVADDGAFVQPGARSSVNIALPVAVTIGNLNFGNSANPQAIDIGN